MQANKVRSGTPPLSGDPTVFRGLLTPGTHPTSLDHIAYGWQNIPDAGIE